MVVVAGHARLEAARQLGLETVPVHVAKRLSETAILADEISAQRATAVCDHQLGLEHPAARNPRRALDSAH